MFALRRKNFETEVSLSVNALNVFLPHYVGGIWKQNNKGSFWIMFEENSVREMTLWWRYILLKSSLKSVFEKLCFREELKK